MEKYINRCFELAKMGLGETKTNPIVGSVIVYNGRIIGEGYHQKYGEAHAEVNAVKSVAPQHRHLLKHATIYVSLEPCFHFGKTPPCVDLILQHKIPKVVISVQDPFAEVAGKSIEKLRKNGVEVVTNVLNQAGKFLIRRFLTNVQHQRPYVILKYAQSKDGFMGQEKQQIWLTDAYAKRLVHRWRKEESAILIGKNTALIDNPNLTNRLYFGRSPIRVIIDRTATLPQHLHIFDGAVPTILVCEKQPLHALPHIDYLEIDFDHHFLNRLLTALFKKRISSLIVEGGAATLQHFIKANLWDEARVFTAPKWLQKGIPAPTLPFPPTQTTIIGTDELSITFSSSGRVFL